MSTSKCCTCGHEWPTGTNGSHSCTAVMERTIERIAGEVVMFTFIDESAFLEASPLRKLCEQINALKRLRDKAKNRCENIECKLGQTEAEFFNELNDKLVIAQDANVRLRDTKEQHERELEKVRAELETAQAFHAVAVKELDHAREVEAQCMREVEIMKRERNEAERADTLRARAVIRCQKYDTLLSMVMPADFKDWHENSRDEWPEVASMVIQNLRKREVDAVAANEKALDRIAELEAQIVTLESGKYGRAGMSSRIAELEAALKPFAESAGDWSSEESCVSISFVRAIYQTDCTVGDLRRAAVLAKSAEEPSPVAKSNPVTFTISHAPEATDIEVGSTTSGRVNITLLGGSVIRIDVEWAKRLRRILDNAIEGAECQMKARHSPDCDSLDTNPEGIVKPCNCHASRGVADRMAAEEHNRPKCFGRYVNQAVCRVCPFMEACSASSITSGEVQP